MDNDAGWTQLDFELPDDVDPGAIRVVYIDPDTGYPVESTLDEMPEGAKILKIDDDKSDNGSTSSRSGRTSSRTKQQKTVKFNIQQQTKRQSTNPRGPNFQGERNQRVRGSDGKMYVVPSEDPYLQGNIISRGQQTNHNVSPLTIFALARSRKEQAAKQARRDRQQQQKRGDYSVYTIDKTNVSPREEDFDPSNISVEASFKEEALRPGSRSIMSAVDSNGTKDDVMKWCLNVFKKSHRQIHFPAKPVRPGSTQSSTRSNYHVSDERKVKSGQDRVKMQEGMNHSKKTGMPLRILA